MSIRRTTLASILLVLLNFNATSYAHDPASDELHFSHPLITESPSPDTKIRVDYFYRRIHESEITKEHTPRVEFEYAFRPTFSIEANVPYTFRAVDGQPSVSHIDNIEVAVKLATFAFKKQRLLPVYGVSLELPSGSDQKEIGSGHIFQIEPYLGLGIKRESFEIVGFSAVGILTNKDFGDEDFTHLSYQGSFLFKPTPDVMPLIEIDGETLLAGPERGDTVLNISPGIKFRPFHSDHWQVGASLGVPISEQEEFHARAVFAAFYHF